MVQVIYGCYLFFLSGSKLCCLGIPAAKWDPKSHCPTTFLSLNPRRNIFPLTPTLNLREERPKFRCKTYADDKTIKNPNKKLEKDKCCTGGKIRKFSVTQIVCEFIFGDFRSLKIGILAISKAPNFDFRKILSM